jgi:hypothetical protein
VDVIREVDYVEVVHFRREGNPGMRISGNPFMVFSGNFQNEVNVVRNCAAPQDAAIEEGVHLHYEALLKCQSRGGYPDFPGKIFAIRAVQPLVNIKWRWIIGELAVRTGRTGGKAGVNQNCDCNAPDE